MFCGNCGKQLQDGAKFCPACGTAIYQEENNNIEQHTVEEPIKDNGVETTPVKQKSKKALWIPIVAVACVAAIVAGIFLLPGLLKSRGGVSLFTDTSAENYYNSYNMAEGTYIARNDSYIFYINNNGAVIRMDDDFSNRKVVVDGKKIDIVYLFGETLYYHDSETRQIFSSNIDGEDEQQIVTMQTCWFTIADGQLYFLEGYSEWDYENERVDTYGEFALYKSSLDGTGYEKIIPYNASSISIQDDCIIYWESETNTIYSVNLDGTNQQAIHVNNEEDFIHSYKIYEGKLYYANNAGNDNVSGLYCLDIKTGEEQKLVSTIPGDFTFWNDHIIYEADTNSSAAATHMCDLDGSNDKTIIESYVDRPLVMGNYMYYYEGGLSSSISVYNLETDKCEAFEMNRYKEVVFTDKYIFYIDSEDDNIYRCDHDGNNVVKLTNADCNYLYTYKNSLYYSGYANGYNSDNDETPSGIHPFAFFRLEDDGKDCYAVELNGSMSNYIFYNDYAYFTSSYDSHVYRTKIDNIDTDDTNRPFIRRSGDGHYSTIYFIENDWIYFSYWKTNSSDSATVARMSLDGDDMQIVIESSAYDLTVYDNKIYYLKRDSNDNWQLRRVNMDGTNDILMLKADISEYAIVDDVIYYINNADKNIYSLNLDGTKRTQLNSTACDGLQVYGDRIYFTDLYDHGYFYSMKLDGSDCKVVIEDNKKFTEATDYKTKGIDDAAAAKEENKDVSYSASDIMTFEDPEFEEFLCEMFQKEKGTITGADLLSIKFFGYYEGAPDEISVLMNRGTYRYLYENSVLFSTETYPTDVDEIDVLCGDDSVDGEMYREGCTVVTVRSNEWMAEHVMPYLYYFKNMKHVAFGYCWVGDNPVLPIGVDWQGINPHARYADDPYDPLYE